MTEQNKTKQKRNIYSVDETLEKSFDKECLKRGAAYIVSQKRYMITALIIAIITSLITLMSPIVIQKSIDDVIRSGGKHYGEYKYLIFYSVCLVAIVVTTIVLNAIRAIIMAKATQNIVLDIRKDLFSHLQMLPFSYYDSRPQGKILVRVVGYTSSVSNTLSNGVINAVMDILNIIFIIVFMFIMSWKLALAVISGLPILVFVLVLVKPHQRKAWQNYSNKKSNLTAYTCENIEGVKVTEMFDREEENKKIYKDLTIQQSKSWFKCVLIQATIPNSVENISFWAKVGIYAIAVFLFPVGVATPGLLTGMAGYCSRFWDPINNLSSIYNEVMNSVAYLERIFETMDYPVEITDKENAYELPQIQGGVEFKNVDFGYDPEVLILKDVSFKVKPGESIALVGPTGAGKSTIVNLISRFYDVQNGEVLIDGHSVTNVTIESLRTQMGIMLQDPFIFSGTIEDNIRYGKLDATEEEILLAAKTVCADEFISEMPDGYKTVVKERGSGLSQGQKQLISLARTIVSDPRILVLDEATSSVDARTERVLQDAVNILMKGRTSFIVAHRLSTIQSCDRIMFIENGKIAECGSHDELMEKKGRYYSLYTAQQ